MCSYSADEQPVEPWGGGGTFSLFSNKCYWIPTEYSEITVQKQWKVFTEFKYLFGRIIYYVINALRVFTYGHLVHKLQLYLKADSEYVNNSNFKSIILSYNCFLFLIISCSIFFLFNVDIQMW
jgi:hypothetical protein